MKRTPNSPPTRTRKRLATIKRSAVLAHRCYGHCNRAGHVAVPLLPQEPPCRSRPPHVPAVPSPASHRRGPDASPGACARRPRRAVRRRGATARSRSWAACRASSAAPATGSRTAPRPNSPPTDTAGVYAAEFEVPAGSTSTRSRSNDAWDESYGAERRRRRHPAHDRGPARRCGSSSTTPPTASASRPIELAAATPPTTTRSSPRRSASPAATSSSTSS